MATLVLTTIGTIVGGPIGGAIGALLGQQVDQRLLAPKGRQGPRLNDLSVQTSTYGAAIPKIFGRLRVAGTVIWATDLKEQSHRSGGGKGSPKVTTYSYSASFAVALSARPIRASTASGPTANCCAAPPATGRARPDIASILATRRRRWIR